MTCAPSPEFDEYANRYDDDLRQSIPGVFAEGEYFAEYKVLHVARRLLNREVTRFLDFGCGTGHSLYFANEQFPKAELWGYDLSARCIEMAQQRAPTAKLTANLNDLPTGGFDVVLAANVFHHIPLGDRKGVMARCKSLIQPEGRLFLFEHNPLNPVTRRIFERCPFDKGATMLRRHEVLSLAKDVGLTVVRSDYTLFFPRQLRRFRPFERTLGWLPLGAQYCVEMTRYREEMVD